MIGLGFRLLPSPITSGLFVVLWMVGGMPRLLCLGMVIKLSSAKVRDDIRPRGIALYRGCADTSLPKIPA
jgi:hypothetical protein